MHPKVLSSWGGVGVGGRVQRIGPVCLCKACVNGKLWIVLLKNMKLGRGGGEDALRLERERQRDGVRRARWRKGAGGLMTNRLHPGALSLPSLHSTLCLLTIVYWGSEDLIEQAPFPAIKRESNQRDVRKMRGKDKSLLPQALHR